MEKMKEWLTYENLLNLLNEYHSFGWFVGFLLPFFDAFMPVFPLVVIITVNVAAYGFWFGFFLSWAGNVMGTLTLFFLLRKYEHGRITQFLYRPNKNHPFMNWIDRSGFAPIFIVLCFPFTPSFFVNIFAAFSKVNTRNYTLAVVLGKFVMILTVSYIGHDIRSFFHNPLKTLVVIVTILVLWFIGKMIEKNIISKHNT